MFGLFLDVEGISSISRGTTIIKDIKSYVDDLKSYKSKISGNPRYTIENQSDNFK